MGNPSLPLHMGLIQSSLKSLGIEFGTYGFDSFWIGTQAQDGEKRRERMQGF